MLGGLIPIGLGLPRSFFAIDFFSNSQTIIVLLVAQSQHRWPESHPITILMPISDEQEDAQSAQDGIRQDSDDPMNDTQEQEVLFAALDSYR